jgi:hypothetical protein
MTKVRRVPRTLKAMFILSAEEMELLAALLLEMVGMVKLDLSIVEGSRTIFSIDF